MSEIRNENQPTWADIEVALATEIVASNLAWIMGEMK